MLKNDFVSRYHFGRHDAGELLRGVGTSRQEHFIDFLLMNCLEDIGFALRRLDWIGTIPNDDTTSISGRLNIRDRLG